MEKAIYIAGPMRGIPNFNFPLFFKVEEDLRAEGWEVFNPARKDCELFDEGMGRDNPEGSIDWASETYGFDLRVALQHDTSWICNYATAIYMLPGWENSKGAMAEHALACALDLEVIHHLDDTDRLNWLQENRSWVCTAPFDVRSFIDRRIQQERNEGIWGTQQNLKVS